MVQITSHTKILPGQSVPVGQGKHPSPEICDYMSQINRRGYIRSGPYLGEKCLVRHLHFADSGKEALGGTSSWRDGMNMHVLFQCLHPHAWVLPLTEM